MTGEGFAFQCWYLLKYGPHVSGFSFTPITAMFEWHEGIR